jgi:methionyl-tRNA formyltransferase
MKTIFLGTPNVAVDFLKKLDSISEVKLVITMPDKPVGRKMKVTPSPVKLAAKELCLECKTPENSNDLETEIKNANADVAIVVAYGRILKESIINSTKLGMINFHFSLLPKYRGPAPVQWSLINGEIESGVTAFWIDKGVDSGPVLFQERILIEEEDDAKILLERLCKVGVKMLEETIKSLHKNEIIKIPQKGSATHAPLLEKKDAWLDFDKTALEVHNRVRGLAMGPVAKAALQLKDKAITMQILKTSTNINNISKGDFKTGTILRVERGRGFIVKCSNSEVLVEQVKPEGKNVISAFDFASGYKVLPGDFFISEKE